MTADRPAVPMLRGNRPSEMLIPNGQTCGDCAHFKRCGELLGIVNSKETLCDWDPHRFQPLSQNDTRRKA